MATERTAEQQLHDGIKSDMELMADYLAEVIGGDSRADWIKAHIDAATPEQAIAAVEGRLHNMLQRIADYRKAR